MIDTTEHLDRLEADMEDRGHAATDQEWAREAYFRLLLCQVKSSAAQSQVRLAAAEARSARAELAAQHGPAARWAQGRAQQWLTEAPGRFVDRPDVEDGWTWRSALWGIPALAVMFGVVFALVSLLPGSAEGQDTVAWVLLPGLLAIPVVGAGVVYRHVLAAHGHLRAVLTAGLAVLVSIPVITWLVMDALRVSLPPQLPWSWLALLGYVLLAVGCWQVSRRIPGSGADEGPSGPVDVMSASEPVDDRIWFSRFRAALHERGSLTDREVRRSIEEAREHVGASGGAAVEEFGSPWEYARSLTHDPRVAPRRATLGYGALALFWFVMAGQHVVSGDEGDAWTRLALGLLVTVICVASARQWHRAAQDRTSRRSGPVRGHEREGGATGA